MEFDCLKCGLCCWVHKEQDCYAEVTQRELKRLGSWGKRNVKVFNVLELISPMTATLESDMVGAIKSESREIQAGPVKGYTVLLCAALEGSPMHSVKCKIYKKRPSSCKTSVKRGDAACRKLREGFLTGVAKLDQG